MQGCGRLRYAFFMKCIEMHLGEYCSSQVEPLTSIAAGKTNLASVAGCKTEADSPAGHKRKHNARRTGTRVCVSGIPISEE